MKPLLCFSLFWVVPLAGAQAPAPPTLQTRMTTTAAQAVGVEVAPVDRLQEKLFKVHKNARARKLKTASDALRDRKWEQAKSAAGGLTGDALFGDIAQWIVASAERGVAEDALSKKQWEIAQQAARRAVTRLATIEQQQAASPFVKSLSKEIARSELVIAQALVAKAQWAAAQVRFESAFQRHVNAGVGGQLEPEPLARYAEACSKKKGEHCAAWILRLSYLFPRSAPEIKALQSFFPQAGERLRAAAGVGRGSTGYKSPDLDQTAFDSAMRVYFEERWGQAVKQLRQFLDDYPRSVHRYRARYWLAQAMLQQQDHEKSKISFESLVLDSPLSYYGLLSSLASGRSVDAPISPTLPDATDHDPALFPSELFHLKRAQHLLAERAYDLATHELREIRAREPISSPFLVYLAMLNHRCGNYTTVFSLLGELINRGYEGVFSSYALRMIFPLVHMETIQKTATELGVDPFLVLSLIKQESAFDARANSSVGAQGLMQLMPQTAIETDPGVQISELGDAETNIRVGTKYLKQLLTRFNGNIVLSLAAYNAGPNAVDRWLREIPQKRGLQEFIESIPYKETREYVAGIIRNYYWYSRKITGEFPKSLSYFWNVYGPPELPPRFPSKAKSAN